MEYVDMQDIYIYIIVVERTETKEEEIFTDIDTYESIFKESNPLYLSSYLMDHLSLLPW